MKVKIQAVVPAAGSGVRLRNKVAKPFVILAGRPLVVYALQTLLDVPQVDSVILAVHEDHQKDAEQLLADFGLERNVRVIAGGATRSVSVFNALRQLDEDTELVIVHDGARPLVRRETIEQAVRLCYDGTAVITAVPVKSTVKRVDPETMTVEATLNRDRLWEVQTPQVFTKEIILRAHREVLDTEATDDARLVEALNVPVKVCQGDYGNLKVTTPEDLVVAEALLKSSQGV